MLDYETDHAQEMTEFDECDAVESVWQNKLATFGYVTLAALVSYALVVSFVLLEG